MHGRVLKDPASGQERGEQDQDEGQGIENKSGLDRMAGTPGDQIGVDTGDQDDPGHQ